MLGYSKAYRFSCYQVPNLLQLLLFSIVDA